MTIIGIDISKGWFDCFCTTRTIGKQFPNNPVGWEKFLAWTNGSAHIVMEASGPYYLNLATWLYEQEVTVSVVNPLVIRRYSQMKLSRTKTDAKDAALIACYGVEQQPKSWIAAVQSATSPKAAYELKRWFSSPAGRAKRATRSIRATQR